MSRITYVNGRYLPHAQASVHVEDRGFQFADGCYEVVYLHEGRLIDATLHLDRLDRSLRELHIAAPLGRPALVAILGEVIRRGRRRSGLIYIQVTRGVARREHAFPPPGTPPSLVITFRRAAALPASLDGWTAAAITLPDERWARCDIKSVSLLPNVLARQAAREQGALEAILHDRDGIVTEGASTSVWIVDAQGILRTRKLDHAILPGCTRAALAALLQDEGVEWEERAFSLDEMRGAGEILLTAATTFVKPVLTLDGKPVGEGVPGPVARRLFALFARHMRAGSNGRACAGPLVP